MGFFIPVYYVRNYTYKDGSFRMETWEKLRIAAGKLLFAA
jgi:hypothetical protein